MKIWQDHPAKVQFASQGILQKVLNLQDEPLVVMNVGYCGLKDLING